MRVLIAEDDPVSRVMLQATLKKWGHEPVVSCDGREALSILEQESPPDIAILDWMMPEMDGPEVCRRIRQKKSPHPVYIILLTAKAQREGLVTGLEAGADDYVTKPFNHSELFARLQVGIRIVGLRSNLAERVKDLEVALMRLNQLQQVHKLEALGQLAAGVAHEINTPTQYIGDNIRFLQESWEQLRAAVGGDGDDADISFLNEEIPKAIDESLQGVERVAKIVRAMRDFSHPSGEHKVPVDINRAIQTTITVSANEWKYVADVVTDLDPELPTTMCLPGEIQQVLLNLIVNAAHAIGDVVKSTNKKGVIRITTTTVDGSTEIRVSDTGSGIPEVHQRRIFEPFFTTKDIGKGTGQGLAIAYSVIVQQHNGKIWFETEVGKGTTFFLRLPIDGTGVKENEHEKANLVC
jgi:signal transduction histidine kinase